MKKLFLALTLLLTATVSHSADFSITVSVNKAGEVLTTSSPNCPATTLPADGSLISRATYPKLFQIIGTAYGEGDGSTTFALPDYRGQFLRSAGSVADPDFSSRPQPIFPSSTNDNKVGSFQGDVFGYHDHGGGNHNHTWNSYLWYVYSNGALIARTGYNNIGSGQITETMNYSGNIITPQGGSETRPKNISVQHCIAY